MTDKTLYLLQSSFAASQQHLQTLTQLMNANDAIVFMGDCVLHYAHPALLKYQAKYALTQDLEILGNIQHSLTAIGYAEFADLCLQFNRCISLK